MPKRPDRTQSVRWSGSGAAVLAATCGLAMALAATPAAAQATRWSGESFEGVRLPLSPREGELSFSARRGWAWSVEDAPGTRTRRLLLEGDVAVEIAGYRFDAARAVVWLKPLPDAGPGVYQVFALFDNVSSAAADAGVGLDAARLPVQGVVRDADAPALRVDLLIEGPPRSDERVELLLAGEQAMREMLARATGGAPARPQSDSQPDPARRSPATLPEPDRPMRTGEQTADRDLRNREIGDRPVPPGVRSDEVVRPPEDPTRAPITQPAGAFFVSVGDRVIVQAGEDANTVLLTGGVVIEYDDRRVGTRVQISAERAVLFLRPGRLIDQIARIDADTLEGIYLEGEILATDGSYTLRGPSMYYDVRRDRAVVADAVFWTYDQRTRMPLYVRAERVRQTAADEFVATNARMANTAFSSPHLTIGATDIALRVNDEDTNPGGVGGRVHVDAENITLNAGELPIFWWPGFSGDPEQFPLRNVQVSDTNRVGTSIQTTWSLFTLLGQEAPSGVDAELLIDFYSDRGWALGTDARWSDESARGEVSAYLLPEDNGTDVGPNGSDIDQDGDTRGMILGEHQQNLSDTWRLDLELSYISDESFVEAFFPRLAENRREFTNRASIRRLDGDTLLRAEVQGTFNDFIANQYLLQSPGYTVDRLPEVSYIQNASDLLSQSAPGLLTHTWEASAGALRIRFSEVNAEDYGFQTRGASRRAFGTEPDESLGDALRAQGFSEDVIARFDTRHELNAQFDLGPVRVTPFVVGRLTAYDTDFSAFSPDETDSARLWGAAGVTLATQIQRVDDGVASRMFDLHRMRHIIEPSITIWAGESNIEREDLPVYDDDVEDLLTGTSVRVGLDQTWQTKRGGPGRWRSVDVFRLDTEYVWTSDDAGRTDAIPRYLTFRPELSNPGEYFAVRGAWQASEVVGLAGETIYDLESSQQARTSAGVVVDHTDDFSTSAEFRFINPADATYGTFTARYRLTDKYEVRLGSTYNFRVDDFQNVSSEFYREFPNGVISLVLSYDSIRDETSFGFNFRPNIGGARGGFGSSGRAGFGS
ncbi:MAG: LPS assembly protein LptD [Planctomycetota bacterium]